MRISTQRHEDAEDLLRLGTFGGGETDPRRIPRGPSWIFVDLRVYVWTTSFFFSADGDSCRRWAINSWILSVISLSFRSPNRARNACIGTIAFAMARWPPA